MSKRRALRPNIRVEDVNARQRHMIVGFARAASKRFHFTDDCQSLAECKGQFQVEGKTYKFETSKIEGKIETVIRLAGRSKLSDEEVSALLIKIGPKDDDTLSTFLSPKNK